MADADMFADSNCMLRRAEPVRMNYSVSLQGEELERLLFAIETSVKVTKRFQFFLWAQGALQSFLPHETLVCSFGDLANMRVNNEVFSRAVIPDSFERLVRDSQNGLMPSMLKAWRSGGRQPVAINDACRAGGLALDQLRPHILCHGVAEPRRDQASSFFVFLGMPHPPGEREAYLAELLMPNLHMALQRMWEGEAEGGRDVPLDPLLSERELQVLAWVRDGKTNYEIGQILDISPLTVKNHVQKILRKLNVSNRAQAVASAVASGLISGSEPSARTN